MSLNCTPIFRLLNPTFIFYLSETTVQGVKKTKLAQTLLNGSNIALVRSLVSLHQPFKQTNVNYSWFLEVLVPIHVEDQ
jgi:hypothetical protein